MTNHRWTEADKSYLAHTVLDFMLKGFRLKEAFGVVSNHLGIPESKVKSKWSDSLRAEYTEDIKIIKKQLKAKKEEIELKRSRRKNPVNTQLILFEEDEETIKKHNMKNKIEIKPKKNISKTTNLQMLINSIKTLEQERFSILKSGKGEVEFIVVNNEEERGYLVKTNDSKVIDCNCPHRVFRNAICKHMIKLATEYNLEVF